MPKITVVPFGGLGNRMRVLNSALLFNDAVGKAPLKMIWLVKPELKAPFHSLFSSIGKSIILIHGLKYLLFRKFLKHIYIIQYPKFHKFFLSFFYDQIIFDEEAKNLLITKDYSALMKGKKVLIATCFDFYSFSSFDNFIPSKKVLENLEQLKLPVLMIGVHIRRTDHRFIIEESSLDSYIQLMLNEIKEKPLIKFYLATDDYEVKELLMNKFEGHIITQEIELSRNSTDAVQGAWVDILALSQCVKIICNLKSSFVETALKIGPVKDIIEA